MTEAQVDQLHPKPPAQKYYEPLLEDAVLHIEAAEIHAATKTKLRSMLSKTAEAATGRQTALEGLQADKYISELAKEERAAEVTTAYTEHQNTLLTAFNETIETLDAEATKTFNENLPELNYDALAFARDDVRMLLDPIEKDLKVLETLQELMQGTDADMRNLLLFTPFTDRYLASRNLRGIQHMVNDTRAALLPNYVNDKAKKALSTKAEIKKLKQAQTLFSHAIDMMSK